MIPESFIQELLHRVDIVDVVERHVKLKRAGANYSACCPFHTEKSPSFTVSPTKQFYHCFGCGAHGTAIGFLMEYSGLGFIDAVKELAQSVGMQVPERTDAAPRKADTEDLYGVLLEAARFYRSELKNSPRAIEYLKQRGLSGEIAKRFGIGYAPDGWQPLAGAFEDYNAKSLMTAGLVKQNDEGRRFDMFRDRIMFPIVDVRGNVIGFGGRVLGAGEPKYLNSPETPVFEKGRELYGLYQARRAIRDAGRVLVVEGYMDVVALAQHGVEYAVATLGTATTPLHVQKLLRQTDELVYSFDGDNAGRRAAWRALENSLAQLSDGKQVKFLFLPQGEDPDSYVRAHGREDFEKLLDGAMPLSRYLLEELSRPLDLEAAEGRAALIHAAKPLVKQITAGTLLLQIVHELARRAQLEPAEVEQLCELKPVAVSRPQTRSETPPARAPRQAPTPIARHLVRLLLAHPTLAQEVGDETRTALAAMRDYQPVVTLLDLLREPGVTTAAGVFERLRASPHAAFFDEVGAEIMDASAADDAARADLAGLLRKLEVAQLQEELSEILSRPVIGDEDRQRYARAQRRLAELKGVPGVAERAPAAGG